MDSISASQFFKDYGRFQNFFRNNNEYCCIHLIDGDGTLNAAGIENFMQKSKLSKCGISYALVSIIGPQSSGKSTMLNHLFGTNFKEMNEIEGRSQTTKGIWLANCTGINTPTIVMDVEGNDGLERKDNTTFERQSALFTLAVSDIVLINMWCHDIGRQNASNKPLLEHVFQVMLKLFTPRKTTLMFLIRDKTKTPLECLEALLRKQIQEIWNSVVVDSPHKDKSLNEFFNVEVVVFSNYEHKRDTFEKEVACFRQRFFHSIAPGGIAEDRRSAVSASAFSLSIQQIWKKIEENVKILDIPAHNVMVATFQCQKIADERFNWFSQNKEWHQLKQDVQSSKVDGYKEKLFSLLNTCLSEYEVEAAFFDEGVRNAKEDQLKAKLQQLVQPTCQSMLQQLLSRAKDKFNNEFIKAIDAGEGFSEAAERCRESSRTQFIEGCAVGIIEIANWDISIADANLQDFINAYIASAWGAKQSEHTAVPVQHPDGNGHNHRCFRIQSLISPLIGVASMVLNVSTGDPTGFIDAADGIREAFE